MILSKLKIVASELIKYLVEIYMSATRESFPSILLLHCSLIFTGASYRHENQSEIRLLDVADFCKQFDVD